MKLRAVASLVSLVPVALALSCGGGQPPPQCTIGRGGNAVRYFLSEGTGPCSLKKGEVVGAQSYRVPPLANPNGAPPTLALQPHSLQVLQGQDADATHLTYSSGAYTTDYPASDFCVVPATSEARQSVPANGATPAMDLRYTWSNVRIFDSTGIPGTQWSAELSYSEGACTARYKAVGLFPAISCQVQEGGQPKVDANGKPVTDAALCKSKFLGLSIDPHFPVECEPESALCVLAGEPGALIP